MPAAIRRSAVAILALTGVAMAVPALSQSVAWSRNIVGAGNGFAYLGDGRLVTRAMAVARDGSVVVTGTTSNGSNNDFLTTRLAADTGAITWQKTFNGAANGDDEALSVAADAAGNVYVVGHSFVSAGNYDLRLIKYAAATGAVLWEKSFGGGGADFALAVATDADGNAIVAAEGPNAAGNVDMKVLKFAANNGVLQWQRSIDSGGSDFISDLALDGAGNVLATGVSLAATGVDSITTFKLAASNGAVAWTRSFDGGGPDESFAIAVDAAGNAFVTGYASVAGARQIKTLKYTAADGALAWQQTLPGAGGGAGEAIAVDAAGNPVVLAQVGSTGAGVDFRTVKHAGANGAILWDRSFDSGGPDYAYQVAIDAAGNAVVVGSSQSGGATNWRAVHHAAGNGSVIWQYTYNGSANQADDLYAVATSAGAVYLAGLVAEAGQATGVRVAKIAGTAAAKPPSDFDGDGKADMLWQSADGAVTAVLMDGATALRSQPLIAAGTGWAPRSAGDVNSDGKADILWQRTDGSAALWLMNGAAQSGGTGLLGPGTGWSVASSGDLNGDGKSDIVWQHTDGSVAVWLMDGVKQVGGGRLLGAATGWRATLAGDFNGDGKADVLYRHTDGSVALWLMNGVAQAGGNRLLGAGTGWTPTHVADFDGDRKVDILWRHTDGSVALWLMDGGNQAGGGRLVGAATGWSVRHVGDYNGDGKADIVWQHADGRAALWFMDGAASTSAVPLTPPGPGHIVAELR